MRGRTYPFLLILSIVAVYWPVVTFEFVSWDDGMFVFGDDDILKPSFPILLDAWENPSAGLYIPLTRSAWMLLSWLSGDALKPGLFHSANLLAHAVSALFVFLILRELLPRFSTALRNGEGADSPALMGAMFFALHPVQVETVAWVSTLKDILCGMFSLMAIKAYMDGESAPDARMRRMALARASAFYLLALFSKPSAVVVPLLALLTGRLAFGRPLKKNLPLASAWLGLALIFSIVAKHVQSVEGVEFIPPLWARPFIAGDALAFYIMKIAFPLQVAMDYGRKPAHVMGTSSFYAGWILPVSLLLLSLSPRAKKAWLLSLGIFVAALFPVLGLVPFSYQNISTVADHYLYLPMLGAAISFACLYTTLESGAARKLLVLAPLLLALSSSINLLAWSDEIALYTKAIETNPRSAVAHNNLGIAYMKTGLHGAALRHFRAALDINPESAEAHYNLGLHLLENGRVNDALPHLEKAVEKWPWYPPAHNSLGLALLGRGDFAGALAVLEKGERLAPSMPQIRKNLGLAFMGMGKYEEAEKSLKTALELSPGYKDALDALIMLDGIRFKEKTRNTD